MTVEQLVEALKNFPQSMEVCMLTENYYSSIRSLLVEKGVLYLSDEEE